MMDKRDTVKKINVGGVEIGGGAPVSVQTMCNTKTWDVEATVAQIKAMQVAGADIVRLAIPDMRAAQAIAAIKEQVSVPLVADIHFDHRLALAVAERGIDKIRINPGNIGGAENVKAVAEACRKRSIPIRIGVNAGSLEPRLIEKYGHPCPTCGRTEIDLIGLATEVEQRVRDIPRDITVAVMGCVVNGPGEAREADYGIAGGKGKGLLFKKGQVLGTYPYAELCDRLVELIERDGEQA